jgi:hypothetical protein
MKSFVIAGLVAAQILTVAQPVLAADLAERETPQMGAFAGVRLRMPLGDRARQRLRAGLTIAPTMHVRDSDGASRTRFGEGFELGFASNRPLELSFASTRLDRLGVAPGAASPDGPRAGVSTLGWVAIGLGATLLVVGVAGAIAVHEIQENEYDQ